MGEPFRRFDLEHTPFAVESDMYLLFRRDDSDYLLVGFLSWRIFSGRLTIQNQSLSVYFAGDGKLLIPDKDVKLEDVVFIHGRHWQDVLETYADMLTDQHQISCRKVAWRGWGSWDYYADAFGEQDIWDNYDALQRNGMNCGLVQIDDGYSRWGDWLEVNPDKFPRGIGAVSTRVKAEGGITGLWLAPFVAQRDSTLFAEHPDWFLYDASKAPLLANGMYILDYSIPEVCNWLFCTLTTMKNDWQIEYFKLDFLASGLRPCRSAMGGLTPLERFHRCFKTVKSALGEHVYILGCSAVFGPCLGYVDGMRTGADISPQFTHVKESVHCSIGRWFLHGKIFNCDPDYLVLRTREDEDAAHCDKSNKRGTLSWVEARTWSTFVSAFGNATIAGDNVACLRA
jgi:alpha-galactosidase